MEKFKLHHYHEFKPKNRCEQRLLEFSKDLVSEPLEMTIEQIRQIVIDSYNIYKYENPSHGSVSVGELRVCATIAGRKHFVLRQFKVYATGRKIPTFVISEDLFKDSTQNYRVVKSKLNGDSENE